MLSDPRRPVKVPWTKVMVVGLIAVMGAKAVFHEWMVATLHPADKDRLVMKVERVPCRTGDDLLTRKVLCVGTMDPSSQDERQGSKPPGSLSVTTSVIITPCNVSPPGAY